MSNDPVMECTAAQSHVSGFWRCGRFTIDLSKPRIMGIVNVTPDSFSDGGHFFSLDSALAHAYRLIDEGADMLDIGGESTRPGAPAVSIDEELKRVIPLIGALRDCGVPLSIDTSKADVMRAAVRAGASIVNDVCALQRPGALEAVTSSDCGVVLMHMQGSPRTMQHAPQYVDVVQEVTDYLRARWRAVTASGIEAARIVLDPGFGFGKTAAHNLTLLAHLAQLKLPAPALVGWSRKSTLGELTGQSVENRVTASVVAAAMAIERGAQIVRVHDVAATRDALCVVQAVIEASRQH